MSERRLAERRTRGNYVQRAHRRGVNHFIARDYYYRTYKKIYTLITPVYTNIRERISRRDNVLEGVLT